MQIYEGEVEPWLMSDYCTDTVPVLLRRATFCRAFAADAKDFRAYNSWVRISTATLCAALQYQICSRGMARHALQFKALPGVAM